MSSHRSPTDRLEDLTERHRERARRVIARWQKAGFDTVMCHPSTYCTPANSKLIRMELPEGYHAFPIDSDEALEAMVSSLGEGREYRD